jgi:hypothetical protein
MEFNLFYLGIVILVLNEGFVMSRHYCSYTRQLLTQIKEKWGWKWIVLHSALDVLWILLVIVGYKEDQYHLEIISCIIVAMGIYYIPIMIREHKKL